MKRQIIEEFSLGQRVAEDEFDQLAAYFVETEQWKSVWRGDVDVIYGPKGSGKSAIYSTLMAREEHLFDRNILIRAAENPKGTPAFKSLTEEPPMPEEAFAGLWKLYFLALIADAFEDYGIRDEGARKVVRTLTDAQLRPGGKASLRQHVKNAFEYVRRLVRPSEIEPSVALDPNTGAIAGFSSRISFSEPSVAERARGDIYVDDLLDVANASLVDSGIEIWLLLDRLDVAFAGEPDLEKKALRALFKCYLDLNVFDRIHLKIFLRTDIWKAITDSGFREASHITRDLVLHWDGAALLQLVVQRLVQNRPLVEFYDADPKVVTTGTSAQQDFFYRVYPPQVELGSRRAQTFDWCLTRTQDGTKRTAPRELIHLLTEARRVQLKRLEVGEPEPDGEHLFDPSALKDALPSVSEVRLDRTLYAEYPDVRHHLELLEAQKTNHSVQSLSSIWQESEERTKQICTRLVEIGFFEKRGEPPSLQYWVPFLYRPALHLVQGSAEGVIDSPSDGESPS
ncbi:P-loop ATPase, Sll1717 family [Streptomyces tendae]|uniref:P-loop ATPase, Sll1717 family n=1 Tax=Streptomyces tendae TaxID=1932 RepID=UPI00365F2FC9